jgi:hypothetical protein
LQRSARTRSQGAHIAPPEPQLEIVSAASRVHAVPLQQPPAHEAELQTQVPPEQVCPLPQAGPSPHLQAPAEQVLVSPEHAKQATPFVPQAAAF